MPGPPPSSNARRRNPRPDARLLPAEGREAPAPKWPLTGRAPKLWAGLWELPQAVAWEELHLERIVARYAQKLRLSESPTAPASMCAEVRQLEDRLGLSAMAMLRLRWEVAPARVAEVVPGDGAEVTDLDEWRTLYGA